MRKIICKLFNKHKYKKTGANQYGYYGCCKYCGKRYYKPTTLRGLLGKPVNPNLACGLSGELFTISQPNNIDKEYR